MPRCVDCTLVDIEQSELKVQIKTMKGAILLACVCAFFVNAIADRDFSRGLSRIFLITVEQAEKCINETTPEDMVALDRFVGSETTVVTPSVQRASCTLSCCTQEAGLLIGSKMQMDKVHTRIDKIIASKERKIEIHTAANECSELVKNMTDDCEVVRSLYICLYKKLENHRGLI